MNLPGFSAEKSLGPSAGVYRRKSGSPAEMATGVVRPARKRAQWCETRYRGGVTHYFPVTVCETVLPHLEGSVATMAAGRVSGPEEPFVSRAAKSFRTSNILDRFKRCRVVSLPFYGEVTTTQNCEDTIPDSSVLEVQGHPELTTHWSGGLSEIPAPYNPGWFGLVGQTCGCCGGKVQCPDGSCVLRFDDCTQHPA